jgi:hypothetical protein
MNPSLYVRYFIFSLMMLLSVILAVQVIIFDQAYLYGENELMENIQLGLLLTVAIVFFRLIGEKHWSSVEHSAPSLMLLSNLGAALSISFIIREMSCKETEIDWLIFFVDGQGYKLLMLLIWVPLLLKAFKFKHEYISIVKKSILSSTALFLMAAVVCLTVSALFDKEIIVVEYFRFYEEIAEINGYGFMLLAAMSFQKDMTLAVCRDAKAALEAMNSTQESSIVATESRA